MADPVRLAVLLGLVVTMILRNWVEAWVAVWQGDEGPRYYGQTTLHPQAHVDWLGTLILPLLMVFSGAPVLFAFPKPLQLSPAFHPSPYRLVFLVRLAGCLFHFVLAALLVLFLRPVLEALPPGSPMRKNLALFFYASAISNLGIAYILLLPVPPALGALIVGWLLPRRWREQLIFDATIQYAGMLIILIGLMLPPVQRLLSECIIWTLAAYVRLLGVPILELLPN